MILTFCPAILFSILHPSAFDLDSMVDVVNCFLRGSKDAHMEKLMLNILHIDEKARSSGTEVLAEKSLSGTASQISPNFCILHMKYSNLNGDPHGVGITEP